ncbi:hypothetical protein ACO22_01394 [Paracoccidioides brasiliensis]|uniref:Extracellular mutant protein 11 C-terminal domain-containing protein n=1 Tax=Paracoccidioides brasiliensis TaxID=121759 RepID=A0A1D2JLM1_PARBR|nr:hypothetical protein ACO22_01394 [Paracoccidioides brasiliensis]
MGPEFTSRVNASKDVPRFQTFQVHPNLISKVSKVSKDNRDMAVGEYVRGKHLQNDTPATQGSGQATINPSRELVANMARVKVPSTKLNDACLPASGAKDNPMSTTKSGDGVGYRAQNNNQSRSREVRDIFDTDVETVDDSTTTIASLSRGEEDHRHDIQAPPAARLTSQEKNDFPSYVPFHIQYSHSNSRSRNSLEERMLMELGSDPVEDGHDDLQEPVEHHTREDAAEARDEDEFNGDHAQVFDWNNNHAPNGEPMSWQKIENALRDTKTPRLVQASQHQEDANPQFHPKQPEPEIFPASNTYTSKPTQRSSTGSRFMARSRFRTLNLREGAPQEGGRLIGSLPIPQTSPTLIVPPSPQPRLASEPEEKSPAESNQPNPLQPVTEKPGRYNHDGLFDITDLSVVDSSQSENSDNQPTYTSLLLYTISPVSSKRSLTDFSSDYPQNILMTKNFSDLQAESFDYNPAPPQPVFPPQDPPIPLTEKLAQLKGLTEEQRKTFFASLTLADWERSGDWIIEQFNHLLQRTKAARQKRRQVAAVFEKEIERRYQLVEVEGKGISKRMDDMRTGGMEVLRGGDV